MPIFPSDSFLSNETIVVLFKLKKADDSLIIIQNKNFSFKGFEVRHIRIIEKEENDRNFFPQFFQSSLPQDRWQPAFSHFHNTSFKNGF